MARKVSVADVARLAGVSPTTVSHTLSGKRKVGDETRSRVERAMRDLNYQPMRAAQNLALGRSNLLALVVPDIAIEYFAELAKSVERAAQARHYNLMLVTTSFESESEARYLEMVNSRTVDGIVYVAGASLEAHAHDSLLHGLPVVLVDEQIYGVELPAVVSDNLAGGRIVAEHLAAYGHRSALIFGTDDPLMSGRRRAEGFRMVWSKLHSEVIEDNTGDLSEPSGRAVVERHRERFSAHEITAVFAYNDPMALGVINGLRELGLSVPGDVSVVGFDDSSAGSYSYPTLTTVRQDIGALGQRSVSLLIDALEADGQLEPTMIELPVELIARQSTSQAPSR